jgi:peroxiredoxin
MRSVQFRLAVAWGVAWFVAVATRADDLKVGDSAPAFSGIVGIDDKEHGLKDYESAKVVVLVFTCNHCPVAQAYQDRLVKLQKDYEEKGVRVVAVNVNKIDADKLDKMKDRAKEKKFNFPYLYDESQKIGKDFGAKTTPHVFVLNKERKVAYAGAIDNDMDESKAKKHYLRDAIDALLDGKEPPEKSVKPFGCSIKYE